MDSVPEVDARILNHNHRCFTVNLFKWITMKIRQLLPAVLVAGLAVTSLTACGPTAGDNAISMDNCIKFVAVKYPDDPPKAICDVSLKSNGQVKFNHIWKNVN